MATERRGMGGLAFWVPCVVGACLLGAVVWLAYPMWTGGRAPDVAPSAVGPAASSPGATAEVSQPVGQAQPPEPTPDAQPAPPGAPPTPGGSSGDPGEVCLENLKVLAVATLMYMSDYDGVVVRSEWSPCIWPYHKDEAHLRCPADPTDARLSYGLNAAIAGTASSDWANPAQVVFYYEVDGTGGPAFRHDGGANYAFLDGHAAWRAQPPPGFQPAAVIDR